MTSSSKNALMVFTGSGVKSVRSDNKIEWSCLAKFLSEAVRARHSVGQYPKSEISLLGPNLIQVWYFVTKNCFSDQEKLLKFEAEGREFAKFLRSLFRTFFFKQ